MIFYKIRHIEKDKFWIGKGTPPHIKRAIDEDGLEPKYLHHIRRLKFSRFGKVFQEIYHLDVAINNIPDEDPFKKILLEECEIVEYKAKPTNRTSVTNIKSLKERR